jgi:3-hydroxybutyryl-CoA dehydratase
MSAPAAAGANRVQDDPVSDGRVENADATLRIGTQASRRVTLDAEAIRHFATLCGDHNPLHHDATAAAAGPFGTLIASGPHVVALMMGLDATFLSQRHDALGLGFEFRFVKAVPAGTTLTLEWTVSGIEHKASLRGDVVSVEGRAVDDAGLVYVTATGRNLVRHKASGARPAPHFAASP